MKFSDSLMSLIGEFAAMKHTPDYVPSAASVTPELENKRKPSMAPKVETERRHSLLISVGTVSDTILACPVFRSHFSKNFEKLPT
ncbi:unnamed protein product [Cylicostephanus goldi]|uniref:Uncharacterized protein n=1 Tax=Cylicostephanus goldi TaxID=71465 RepID=A0A3P7NBW7_CYLGO|nr:unnamed protein product [Cylicostephanus goldi]